MLEEVKINLISEQPYCGGYEYPKDAGCRVNDTGARCPICANQNEKANGAPEVVEYEFQLAFKAVKLFGCHS